MEYFREGKIFYLDKECEKIVKVCPDSNSVTVSIHDYGFIVGPASRSPSEILQDEGKDDISIFIKLRGKYRTAIEFGKIDFCTYGLYDYFMQLAKSDNTLHEGSLSKKEYNPTLHEGSLSSKEYNGIIECKYAEILNILFNDLKRRESMFNDMISGPIQVTICKSARVD